jgi:putative ABC transport system permease protein
LTIIEIIKQAQQTIFNNKLRTILTACIIGFGIMALVGIATAIESLKSNISSNFTSLGANSFSLKNKETSIRLGSQGRKPKIFKKITYDQAMAFKQLYSMPAKATISARIASTATVKSAFKKSNPNIVVFAVDENYFKANDLNTLTGRSISKIEMDQKSSTIVLGVDLAKLLFKNPLSAPGNWVTVGDKKYQVIGVLKSKGASQFTSLDNTCFIPLSIAKLVYGATNFNCVITVNVNTIALFKPALSEAEGLFRVIRKTQLSLENDFETQRSDDIAQTLIENIKYINLAAIFIGLITLLGAAIGLMNIMLVSVNERTREIGIVKAIGATNRIILLQFLMESILICQLGGLLGIVLGIIAGNSISFIFDSSFIIPYLWIIIGVLVCLFVGVIAGIYPAIKAAKLHPIEALRVN